MSKKILFICWVSWSWKWTVVNALLQTNKFKYFPSYVTRDARPWEISWERYIFISNEEFKKSLAKKEFLEYNLVHNQNKYYGTKNDIIEWLKWDQTPIKEVDMIWLQKIVEWWKLKNKFISIFLDVSEKTMIERIHKRWAPISDEELNKRLMSAQKEKKIANQICDYVLNIDWGTEAENIKKVFDVLKKEKIL